MQIVPQRRKRKCLHLTTVSDEDLLSAAEGTKPVAHAAESFTKRREEEARIIGLDLVTEVYKGSKESFSVVNATNTTFNDKKPCEISGDGVKFTNVDDSIREKKESLELLQKSFTEAAQLVDLACALNNEKNMTLVTKSLNTHQSNTQLPVMQQLSISKARLRSAAGRLGAAEATLAGVIAQRQSYTRRLIELKSAWRVQTLNSLGGRPRLAVDCSPHWMSAGLTKYWHKLVPFDVSPVGEVSLPLKERKREFFTLSMTLVSTENGLCGSAVSADLWWPRLVGLACDDVGVQEIHRHCQYTQCELLDGALMLRLRQDACVGELNRWIVGPAPSALREPRSLASSEISSAITASDLNGPPEIHAVHRSEIVIQVASNLLLYLRTVRAPREKSGGGDATVPAAGGGTTGDQIGRVGAILQRSLLNVQHRIFQENSRENGTPAHERQEHDAGSTQSGPAGSVLLGLVADVKRGLHDLQEL